MDLEDLQTIQSESYIEKYKRFDSYPIHVQRMFLEKHTNFLLFYNFAHNQSTFALFFLINFEGIADRLNQQGFPVSQRRRLNYKKAIKQGGLWEFYQKIKQKQNQNARKTLKKVQDRQPVELVRKQELIKAKKQPISAPERSKQLSNFKAQPLNLKVIRKQASVEPKTESIPPSKPEKRFSYFEVKPLKLHYPRYMVRK